MDVLARCPVCEGRGTVPFGFYLSQTGQILSTGTGIETCRSCDGKGIVPAGGVVWHKDGPLAQIETMARWLDDPLDAEHRRKVQTNLRAAADALQREVVELRAGLEARDP